MAKKPDIQFRRIKGRIVPIRSRKGRKITKGASLAVIGGSISVYSGYGAGKLIQKAKSFRTRGTVGAENIFAAKSQPADLAKMFSKPKRGRKKVDPRQLDLFSTSKGRRASSSARKYAAKLRVKGFRRARFASTLIGTGAGVVGAYGIGKGFEKIAEGLGAESKLPTDLAEHFGYAVGTALALGTKGKVLGRGFRKSARPAFKQIQKLIRRIK